MSNMCKKKRPVMSYGCIGVKTRHRLTKVEDIQDHPSLELDKDSEIYFTLICRRDTISFMNFVRGKYRLNDQAGIRQIFSRMTNNEIELIDECRDLEILWENVWGPSANTGERQLNTSRNKFNKLVKGITNYKTDEILTLDMLISEFSGNVYDTAEWGFPKGRKNRNEKHVQAAIREFKEETDLKSNQFNLLKAKPITESYVGSDGNTYKHIYYLVQLKSSVDLQMNLKNESQRQEIGELGLYTYSQAMRLIRDYHQEKKALLTRLYQNIREAILAS